jgi:hypothetical protein
MLLERVTPTFEDYEGRFSGQYEHNYTADKPHAWGNKEWKVITRFDRFGGGKQKQSDYAVTVIWEDVERIIKTLCEAGCPEALAVREARKLATAAEELGWQAPQAEGTEGTEQPSAA